MKALSYEAGRNSRRTERPLPGDRLTVATIAADQAGGSVAEPTGRLVAGRYRLWSVLGRGGMGSVWLAEDELLERPVALKQVTSIDSRSEKSGKAAPALALGEARTAARVDHVGAVRIHDVVKENGDPWIVMEALSGRTLAETINDEGPLPVDHVTTIGLCLLDVLQATHRAGVIHRDVKPGNVQLCDDGRVVLTDFGIAYTSAAESGRPTGGLAGSPGYVSPEQLHGAEPEPASDLFSLGATLFAAVEGKSPFDKGDLFATVLAIMDATPPPFRRAGRLRPVLEGLLATDPDRRWSIDQARAALRESGAS